MSIESLLFILIFVVLSGISSWLERRRRAGQTEAELEVPPVPSPPPRRSPRPTAPASPAPPEPRPATTSSWEEELRRLLEGKPPPAVPAPPLSPPVPAAPPQRRPPSSAPSAPRTPAQPAVPRDRPTHRPPPVITPVPVTVEMESVPSMLAHLEQSAKAYERASQLHEGVAERLRQVDARTSWHRVAPPQRSSKTTAEALAVRRFLGNPRSVREAFATAIVLAPPKSLETGAGHRMGSGASFRDSVL